jgi:hypothetical protein
MRYTMGSIKADAGMWNKQLRDKIVLSADHGGPDSRGNPLIEVLD